MNSSGVVLGPNGEQINKKPGWSEWGFPDKEDLPPGWQARIEVEELIAFYQLKKRRLRVMLGIEEKRSGTASGHWLHLSVSHERATPSHKTMSMCKKLFIGDSREAIAIYPPKSRHVNIADHCLHLWAPLDPRDRSWPRMEKRLPDGTLSI